MQLNPMDKWLNLNASAPYNLGESGVKNLIIQDLFDLMKESTDFFQLDFDHNDTQGSLDLRMEVCALYDNITPDQVLITTGVTEAIMLYFSTSFKLDENVVVITPSFHNLYDFPELTGFEVKKIELKYENQFRLPLEMIQKAVNNQTRAIVLTSPSNPLGVVHTQKELEAILEISKPFSCDVVIDEHYRLMPYNKLNNFTSLDSSSDRIIRFGSPGKCLGCVGLRVGWLIARKDILEQCLSYKSYTTHAIFKGNDYFAQQILKHRTSLGEKFKNWIQQNISHFAAFQSKNHEYIEWIEPQAGTVGFPRLILTTNSFEFADKLLKETGVLVLPGECFNMPGFFRLRLGVEPDYFQEAIKRMQTMIHYARPANCNVE